jgi:membrane fusion protein
MDEPTQLFRKEVLEHRANRLHGDVHISVPITWQLIGVTLLAALVASAFFLVSANYSRVETVPGIVALDRGVAAIVPSRAGIVTAIEVSEGQRVIPGSPLVHVRSEEDMASGRTAPARIIEALEQQDARLGTQRSLMMTVAAQERERLDAQLYGLRQEIGNLRAQISSQRRLVEVAEKDYRAAEDVARQGYISQRDLEGREMALIARRQQLLQLEQGLSAKQAEANHAQRAAAQAAASIEAQAAGVQSTQAALAQRRAEIETAQGYTLTAPVEGTVTAVTARLGQPANLQQPVMVIVPARATTRVELSVPTSAAGFLEPGQEVRLAVDAFPYQRFGTVVGRIVQISSVALPRPSADGGTVPVYLATAELAEPSVMAFGQRQPLLPGMTLSARIVTQRQSLFEWLFEPLFAVQRR